MQTAKRLATVFVFLAALSSWSAVRAGVIFSDNFDDGDVSDWTKATNFAGSTTVTVDSVEFVSPGYSLITYLDVPPLSGTNLYVRASHDFVAPTAGNYTLDLWARSAPCQGCVISYDVLVDGTLLDRRQIFTFESRSFALNGLSAGTHVLSLGMFTTAAFLGRFRAFFDNVTISTAGPLAVPEPASALLFGAGAFVLLGAARRGAKARPSSRA